MPSSTK